MNFIRRLPYIFFPARCCVCDKVIGPGEDICRDCGRLVIRYPVKKAYCSVCGIEYENCSCGKRLLYAKLASPFFYEGDVKRALHRFKFRGRTDLAAPFAKRMADALRERDMLKEIDVITFIPMRKKAKFDRGYNQSEMLADTIGELTRIPVKQLLFKAVKTPKQHSLGMRRRKGNVLGAFEPLPDIIGDIAGKKILVVDDIVTTGSTLNETAKTLLIFGAEQVYAAAAAQGKKRKSKNGKNAQNPPV